LFETLHNSSERDFLKNHELNWRYGGMIFSHEDETEKEKS